MIISRLDGRYTGVDREVFLPIIWSRLGNAFSTDIQAQGITAEALAPGRLGQIVRVQSGVDA